MTWFRMKAPDEIRSAALEMARRKRAAGCLPCVQAYLDLARQHGATDDELREIASDENRTWPETRHA